MTAGTSTPNRRSSDDDAGAPSAGIPEINFDDPHVEGIIDAIARDKPWRWWPDYWFSYVFRRWPLFIYTVLFCLAHFQMWALVVLPFLALYAAGNSYPAMLKISG